MAESLSRCAQGNPGSVMAGLVLCALLSSLPHAMAAGLPDPTRPPAFLKAASESATAAGAAEGLRLQSVLISPVRKVAIISGQTVKVGEMVGGSELIRILEGEVVLRHGGELRTLKLFPEIEKRRAIGKAAMTPARQAEKRE